MVTSGRGWGGMARESGIGMYPPLLLPTRSVVSDSATPWTAARQAPLSMGFSRQEYWSGLPFPSPGDLLNLGVEPGSPALKADSLPLSPQGSPHVHTTICKIYNQQGPAAKHKEVCSVLWNNLNGRRI